MIWNSDRSSCDHSGRRGGACSVAGDDDRRGSESGDHGWGESISGQNNAIASYDKCESHRSWSGVSEAAKVLELKVFAG